MPFNFGTPELIILLVIVLVLFGVGRNSKLGAEFGKGIRELRCSLSGEDEADDAKEKKK